MNKKTIVAFLSLLSAGVALGAWYDQPGAIKLVPLATGTSATEDPHFMNKSADDRTLLVNMQASNDNDGPVLLDMAELADPDNDAPAMRKVFAKPSAVGGIHYKGGAISSDLGLAILGSGSATESCAFLTGEGTGWLKGANLYPVNLGNKMDGLDFGTGSTYLYANLYPNGGIARWSVGEKGTLSGKVTKPTTSTRVRNVSVYSVDGRELVYYGNGADNTTDGKVYVMDVTDADAANWVETDLGVALAGVITNVKLSNEDTDAPILYALTDNGYLGVYKLAADGKSVVETIKTFEPARLKVLSGVSATTEAKFRNFEVTKDGSTAFLINRVDEHNVFLAVLANCPYIEMTAADQLVIDTGYTPGPDTAVWADYAFMGINPVEQYFIYEAGGVNENGNAYFRPYINGNQTTAAGTRCYAWALNKSGWQSTGVKVAAGERHQLLLDSLNNKVRFWTGSAVKEFTPAGARPTKPATTTLKIGSASGMGSNFADMRLYRFKIWEKGELVRNYVPCKKGETVGLYDKVEGLFYANVKNTKNFAAVGAVMSLAEDDANNYIESNGSVAYSTDYYANPSTTWKVDFQFPDTSTGVAGKIVCGAYASSGCEFSTLLFSNGDNKLHVCFKDGGYSGTSLSTAADTLRRQVLVDGPSMKASMYKEGVWQGHASVVNGTCTKTAKWPFMLFGSGNGVYGQITQSAKVRIFGAQIWDNGKLVRDYRPLVLDGKPGLLDHMTGAFLTGPGLTAGSGVPVASGMGEGCIEADGTTAVNTDFWPTDKSRIEVDYAFNDTSVTQKRVYGNDGLGTARRCSVYINGSGNLAFGYGDGFWNGTRTVGGAVNTQRHTVIQDFKGFQHILLTGSVTNGSYAISSIDVQTNFCKSSACPISLFGGSNQAQGWTANNLSKMRIYRARFYEDDVLVRDFVPAKRDGKAGFKDLVTGRFHGANKGTGLSAIGTVVEETSEKPSDNCYIQGKGGTFNYITLPHFPSGATRVECDFQLTQANSGKVLFGSYDCGFSQILYLANDKFDFDCGDGGHGKANLSNKPTQNTLRHTAIIDAPQGVYSLLNADGTVVMTDSCADKTRTATATKPVILFGTSTGSTSGGNGSQIAFAKVFAFRIYEAGVLVHDYVPRKVDGICGFRDLATGEFVTGEGMVGGSDVPAEQGDPYIDTANRTKHAFDTGFVATADTCIEADFAYMVHDNAPQQFIFEAGPNLIMRTYTSGSKTNDAYVAYACADAGTADMYLNDGTHVQAGVRRQVRIDSYNKRVRVSTGSKGGYVNTDKAYSLPTTKENTNTIKIFGNSSANGNYAYARLYGLKIYEAGTLVHDYVPHLVGGEPTLRDKVTGQVLAQMASVNAMSAGGDFGETEIDSQDGDNLYVDTDGTHPISLGYFVKATSKVVVDFAPRRVASNAMLISPWDNGCGKASALWINTVGKFRFIVGNTRTAEKEGDLANGRRHTAVIDAPNRLVELLENGTKSVLRDDDTASFEGADALWPLTLGGSVKNSAGTSFEAKFTTPIRVYGVQIFENGALVHDFVPAVQDSVPGLLDVKGDLGFRTADGLVIGGKPLTGEVTVYVERPENCSINYDERSAALVANVVNAAYYRWTVNGVELCGFKEGTLPISWRRGKRTPAGMERTDTYTVTPIFMVDGEEVFGEPATAVVTSNPLGMSVFVR